MEAAAAASEQDKPLVTIKVAIGELKEEPPDAGDAVLSCPSAANNNGKSDSNGALPGGVRIKEEPVDEEDVPSTTFEISTENALTIKAEPRVSVSDEEIDDDDGDKNKKDAGGGDDDEDEDMDDDDDFDEDDLDDLDFEMDSSEVADSPDSVGGDEEEDANRSSGSSLSITMVKDEPDSDDEAGKGKTKVRIPKEAEDLLESSSPAKKSSFEIGGLRIETVGNYSRCPKCDKNIKSTFIIRHIKLHDVPVEKYECPEKGCDLQVNRINNLFRHLKVVHKSRRPYLCKHCMGRFAKADQLRKHFAEHRQEKRNREQQVREKEDAGDSRTYTCEFPGCGKEYKKRHHLKEHERKHTGDLKYSCEVCGKRFYIQAHMKRHLYSHTGIKPHVCRWRCGAIFASYGGRMKHERINHYDENPLKSECDICGRPFKNTQQLTKHRMTHLNPEERRDYRCSYCHIMFDTIKLRERHEERHKDGEVFSCETCGRVFKNEKNLTHHIKIHHVKKDEKAAGKEAKGGKQKKEPPPKHHCHICGPPKLFCLTSLRRHLARIHSTNYKCPRDKCGKTFKEKFQLDAHVEVHRLRECHLCGKQFRRKQNADIHLLGVHQMTKEDLEKLGRWNPKKDLEDCPEYMTRKVNKKGSKPDVAAVLSESNNGAQAVSPNSGGGNVDSVAVGRIDDDEEEEEEDDDDEEEELEAPMD